MLRYLFLPIAASSKTTLESKWNTQLCAGPPLLIQLYDESKKTDLQAFLEQEASPPFCGLNPLPSTKPCCGQVMDFGALTNTSASYAYLDWFENSYIPRSALGFQYCAIQPDSSNSVYKDTYFKYFLADDKCVDGVVCSSTSVMTIFSTLDCSGSNVTIRVDDNPIRLNSTLTGPITAFKKEITDANQIYRWTALVPARYYRPVFSDTTQLTALIFYSFAGFLSMVVIWYNTLMHCFSSRDFRKEILSQCMWFLWLLIVFIYWITPYENYYLWYFINELQGIIYNIMSLLCVTSSLELLIKFLKIEERRKIMYMRLAVIHVVLAGGNYVNFLRAFDELEVYIIYWQFLVPIYYLFQFFTDTFPPVFIYRSLIREEMAKTNESFFQVRVRILKKQPLFLAALYGQNIITLIYIYICYILFFSDLLKVDRNIMAMVSSMALANVIHEIMNFYLIEHLSDILVQVRHVPQISVAKEVRVKIRQSIYEALPIVRERAASVFSTSRRSSRQTPDVPIPSSRKQSLLSPSFVSPKVYPEEIIKEEEGASNRNSLATGDHVRRHSSQI